MSYSYDDTSSIDVTQLRVSRYHHQYPTSMTLSQDPFLWKTIIGDLYNQFSDKVRVAEILEQEKQESLYRVCATNESIPYIQSHWSRETFRDWFSMNDEDQRMTDSEFDRFVSHFLGREFRKADINRKYCVMRRGGGGLPLGFPQMLFELCIDALELVDFMEISARIPFTSDLNRLLRNFCYHVLVKGTASREVWERHATHIYGAYQILFNELNYPPRKYGVIRSFLRTPEFSEENVDEVIKMYLMSGAWLNFVLRETGDHWRTTRRVVKSLREAVEEVDACRRGRFYSEYAQAVIGSGICAILMSGIRIVLQVQCICDAQIRGKLRRSGSNLSVSSFDAYKDLAKEGKKVLIFGRKKRIQRWMVKVQMQHDSEVEAVMD